MDSFGAEGEASGVSIMSDPFGDELRKQAAKRVFNAAHDMPLLAKRVILTLVLVIFGIWCLGQNKYIPVVITLPLCLLMLLGTWLLPRSWFYWD
jgi:hypothetical protein